ncbi:nitrilase-related carbon-nitrogen hydrolase [Flexibacterium corallicola]|uniref:nitrilase-related carbon-nitrogen hydrolase n=1 Tax=Flexibacterium corallicola TaxID=3037259 RepID=UPI00286FAF07|nr:nitrilase-related carbon-nitrogen hydrolase [Pseudovibrio sp. M1P-2-3]
MPAINPLPDAMSVVLVQFSPKAATNSEEVQQNIDTIKDYIDRACASFPGVDLIVFPEYSTHGFGFDPYASHLKLATTIPGPETDRYSKIAQEKDVWLCVSIVEKAHDPALQPYNSMVIINSGGEVVLTYRKMFPWCPKEPWTPGETMNVCDGPKGSKLAIAICSDFDYPEIAREAAWKGANVIIRTAKYMYPWDHIWGITNQVRAYENQSYVVAVNHTGEDHSYSYFGGSMACDFDGNIICQLGEAEGMTKADLYPALVEEARDKRLSNNYLYQLKHRGYTGVPPDGVKTNPFTIYRDWDQIPDRWHRNPSHTAEEIAEQGRQSLSCSSSVPPAAE